MDNSPAHGLDGALLVRHAAGLFRSVPGTLRFRQVPGRAA
jgi:hypothetical protein